MPDLDQIIVNVYDIIPPDNFATVDAGAKVGTVYTKEQDNAWRKEVEAITQSGIKGVAKPDTPYDPVTNPIPTPWTVGSPNLYEKYDVNAAGVFPNFIKINDQPVEVTSQELQLNEVQIWVKNGVAEKVLKSMPEAKAFIPEFTGSTFPLSGDVQRTYNNSIWKLKTGQTAAVGDIPSYDITSKWEQIGISTDSTFKDFINPILEVGALVTSNGSATPSDTRARTSTFIDIAYAAQLELVGDMLFQNIFYYTASGAYVPNSTQVINAKTFTPNIPATAAKYKFSLFHVTNTQTITQAELDALVIKCYSDNSTTFTDIVENTKASETVITDYNGLIINVADGAYKDLGGIDVNTGVDSPNNTRIRTSKIKVSNGKHIISQKAGYSLWRVYNFKSGVYQNQITSPEFTIDNTTVDEIRIVWSKTNNTTVITQAEVDAFQFVLQNVTIPKLQQVLNSNKSDTNKVSWFVNKKMESIGDSIPFGYIPRNYPGYPGQLDSFAKQCADLLGMQWGNHGISGSTLGRLTASDSTTRSPMVDRYSLMSAHAKVITFSGGTNDLRNISNLGTMNGPHVPETYFGALHLLIQGLLNKYVYSQNLALSKDILIIGVTPIKIYPNSTHNGLQMIDYVNAMKEVCAYYSIPCFDAYNLSGMTPGEFRTLQGTEVGYTDMYNPLITDGVHPTTEGHAIFGARLAGFLKTLVN